MSRRARRFFPDPEGDRHTGPIRPASSGARNTVRRRQLANAPVVPSPAPVAPPEVANGQQGEMRVVDRTRFGIFIIICVLAIGAPIVYLINKTRNNIDEYLGSWDSNTAFLGRTRLEQNHVITLEEWDVAKAGGPKQEVTLQGGQTAYLKRPVILTTTLSGQGSKKRYTGIYNSPECGGDLLILWYHQYRRNILLNLRREGELLKIGHNAQKGDAALDCHSTLWQTLFKHNP